MGLLDGLFSDDPKQQALIMMGLGLLGGAPGGRKNFGADVMNAGLLGVQGYNQGQAFQMKKAEEAQQKQLRDMQIQSSGLNLQNLQQDFADTQQARDILKNRMGGIQQPPANQSLDQGATPSLYGGPVGPYNAQAPSAPPMPQAPPGGSSGPSVVPFGKGNALTNSPAGASEGKFATFNKYNAIADDFESKGLMKQAQQFRDRAEKFRPEIKETKILVQNGQRVPVNIYKDGTMEVAPFGPDQEKAHMADTGSAVVPLDPFTGKPIGQGVKKTQTPGEVASNSIANARLYFDTGMGAGGGAGSARGQPGLPPAIQAQIAKSQAEGLNTGGVTYKNNLDSTVSVGNDLMMRIGESKKALDQFKPGIGAETRLNIARAADALGMPDGIVKAINNGDIAAKQEFMKLSAQQAMETLKQSMGGGGRITQAEFKVFQANNPNIELDPNAINKIYDFAQRVHTRNISEQSALNQYAKSGGSLSEWPAIWTQHQVKSGLMPQDAPSAPQKVQASPLIVTAPDGSVHRFPSTAAANAFKKAIGQ